MTTDEQLATAPRMKLVRSKRGKYSLAMIDGSDVNKYLDEQRWNIAKGVDTYCVLLNHFNYSDLYCAATLTCSA